MEELIHNVGDKVTVIDTILGNGHSTPTTVVEYGTVKDIELIGHDLVSVVIESDDNWEVGRVFSVDEFNQNTISTAVNCFGCKSVSTIFFE